MTPHTIYFVRHGETVSNVEKRIQGRLNTPLTPLGIQHARRNADVLMTEVPDLLRLRFVASPLGRARQTMEVIRAQLSVDPQPYDVDDRLAELSYGDWQGLSPGEIATRFAKEWARRQTPALKWTHVPPRGESYEQLCERLRSWLVDVRGDTILVGHACVGRVLRGLNLGQDESEIPFAVEPMHDRIYRLANGTETIW